MRHMDHREVKKCSWERRFYLLFFFVLIFRIIYLALPPLDLSPDEAYYWDWSRVLDWGYYSKPPMVAWIMAFSTFLGGNNVFSVRLPSIILGSITILATYLFAKRLYGKKAGFFAGLTIIAIPGNAVLSLVMTIDAPLMCFWALSCLFLWMALEPYEKDTPRRPLFWLLAAFFAGMGLLSKQTMAAFPVMAFLFVLFSAKTRKILKSPWPYLCVLIVLLMLTPFLYWNFEHGWITFLHTAHHFEPNEMKKALNLSSFLEFAGSQAGFVSPLLWLLFIASGFSVILNMRKPAVWKTDVSYLTFLGFIPLLGIFVLSMRQDINANWPAPFYITLSILLAGIYVKKISPESPRLFSFIKQLYKPALYLGLFMVILLYSSPWALPLLKLDGSSIDPTKRFKGWKELGAVIDKIYYDLPDYDRTIIICKNRQTVSELAFYMPGQPKIYHWRGAPDRIKSQYQLWPGPETKKGWNVLYITKAKKVPVRLQESLEKMEHIKVISIKTGSKGKRTYQLYYGVSLNL